MLQEVKFRCGHIRTMDLTGQSRDRARKSDWYQKHVICPECRSEHVLAGERREPLPDNVPAYFSNIRVFDQT